MSAVAKGAAGVSRIFLSYRKDDAGFAAASIAHGLDERFGPGTVFHDNSSLRAGTIYPTAIREALRRCGILVALIGPSWLTLADTNGRRRIDNPKDWVRIELHTAFERGIPVVPLLLDDAVLPSPNELPPDIGGLAVSQTCQVRGSHFGHDLDGLADQLGGRVATGVGDRAGWTQINQPRDNGVVYGSQGTQNIINRAAP
jgi:hypothetical protein